jgi:hypothetical protein
VKRVSCRSERFIQPTPQREANIVQDYSFNEHDPHGRTQTRTTQRSRAGLAGALLAAAVAIFPLAACDDDGTGPDERPSQIVDARGDFLAGFVGPTNADLDVVRGEVSFDGQNFVFESTSAGCPIRVGGEPWDGYCALR